MPVARAEPTAALFRVLGHPLRIAILAHLRRGPTTVQELRSGLSVHQSRVSEHLTVLREAGLVVRRPQSRTAIYRLADDDVLRLLQLGERIAARTADGPDADAETDPDAALVGDQARRPRRGSLEKLDIG